MRIDTRPTDVVHADRRSHLERRLIRLRWMGIGLGLVQVAASYRTPLVGVATPSDLRVVGTTLFVGLGVMNLLAAAAARTGTANAQRRMIAMVAADLAILMGITWLYGFDVRGSNWAVLLLVEIEASVVGGMRGALAVTAVVTAGEVVRENLAGGGFLDPAAVTFRVFVLWIGGLASGMGARALELERRDVTARSEEVAAINQMFTHAERRPDPDQGFDDILEALHEHLGLSVTALWMRDGNLARCIAARGGLATGRNVRAHEGPIGRALTNARPQLAGSSTTDRIAAIPIVGAAGTIAVLEAHTRHAEMDVPRLIRLASQLGVILSNIQLAQERRNMIERVGMTAHELRGPLTALSGLGMTLLHPGYAPSDDDRADIRAAIQRRTHQMERLLEDLVVTSTAIAGADVTLHLERVDLRQVVLDTIAQLGPAAGRLVVDLERDTIELLTDGSRLGQVIRNLAENALKYSPSDSPVRIAARRAGTSEVLVEVSDRGSGLDAESIGTIFGPFTRAGGENVPGTGLGLYVVSTLIDALHGSIEVDSERGRGTTFRIRIPLEAAPVHDPRTEPLQSERGTHP